MSKSKLRRLFCAETREFILKYSTVVFVSLLSFSISATEEIPSWHAPSELLLELDKSESQYSENETFSVTSKSAGPQSIQSSSEVSDTSSESVEEKTDFTEDPHLIALARNLKNDPVLIYQFVRTKIQLDYSNGLKKGPLGTYLDLSGNVYDQAELLITLLRISGHTAKYQFVNVGHSANDLARWLKVYSLDSSSDEHDYKMRYLLHLLGAANVTNTEGNYKFKHLIVQWNSDDGDIYLDPSFHLLDFQEPILDLEKALDFDIDKFRETISSEGVVNRNSVISELNAYSDSLMSKIKESKSSASIDDMVGFWKAGVEYVESVDDLEDTSKYITSYGNSYDELPSSSTTTLRIRHRGIDVTLDSREIYTNRLSIYYSNNVPTLYLNGVVKATGSSSSDGQSYAVTFNVNHPGSGDQNWTQYIRAGGAYTIINTWGSVGSKHIAFQEKRLSESQHFGSKTEPLLNQSLMTMGLKWSRYKNISADFIGKVTHANHFNLHTVGIAGTGDVQGIDGGPYVDVAGSFGGFNHQIKPNFISSGLIASAFEHGVIEQNQPFSAVSTVKLFDLAARRQIPLYEANSENWASVSQELEDYSDGDLNSITSVINAGGSVLLPGNGSLTEDNWSGAGYFTFINNGSSYSAGYQISGGLKGGFATSSGEVETIIGTRIIDLESVANVHPSVTRERLASGDGLYSHDDLLVGADKGALKLTRTYNGNDSRIGPFGQGWRHNFNIDISENSEVNRLLESGTALDATASLVATYIVSQLMQDVDESLFNSVGLSASVHQWLMNNYTDNSVVVSVGANTQQYIKLPDGTYSSSPQVKNVLKKFSGLYSLRSKSGTTYRFNSSNLASSIEDRNGNVTTLNYLSGKLDSVENEFQRKLQFEYSFDLLSSITESLNSTPEYSRVVSFDYDDDNRLDEFVDPNGEKFEFRYDGFGRLNRVYSPLYSSPPDYQDTYDVWGKRVKRQTATGNEFLFYSEVGFRNETVDAEGRSSVKYFDSQGDLALEVNALGQKMVYEYDSAHRRVSTQFDENGIRIELEYDDEDNVTERKRFPKTGSGEKEKVESYTHTKFGNIASHTSLDGEVTYYEYDDNGNLKTITSPAVDGISLITSYNYYEDGSVQTETAPDGVKVEYVYYDEGTIKHKLVYPTDDSEPVLYAYTYFPSGDLETSTDPLGNITSYLSYDKARRLKRVSSPSGQITDYVYNKNGQLTHEARSIVDVPLDDTPQHWATTEYMYTRDGHLKKQIDSEGISVSFGYDKMGNQTHIEDADGKKRRILFDALYRPTHEQQYVNGKYVDESVTTYTETGQVETKRDGKGNKTTYYYDDHDQVELVEYPDHYTNESYTYYTSGQIETYTAPNGVITSYEYDALGRLVKQMVGDEVELLYEYYNNGQLENIQQSISNSSSTAETITYTYDEFGRTRTVLDQFGRTVTYGYDNAGRKTNVIYPDNKKTIYKYDKENRLEKVFYNGQQLVHYKYNNLSQIDDVIRGNGANSSLEFKTNYDLTDLLHSFGNNETLGYAYGYSNAGLQNRKSYQGEARLWLPFQSITELYDNNELNQSINVGDNTLDFDGNGNLATFGAMSYSHNTLNQLTSIGFEGITPHINYTYDGLGRRRSKTVNGVSTSYHYDGDEVIAEYDEMGNVIKRFIYGAGIDNPIAYIYEGNLYYYHTDEIGSVVAMSNASGQLVEKYSYGPFGQSYDYSKIGNPLRYAARRLDSETGHYYNRARYYEPKWGKFLQADPLGYQDGMNRYAYVGHNPVSYVDPMGTIAIGGGFSTSAGTVDTSSANYDSLSSSASAIVSAWGFAATLEEQSNVLDNSWKGKNGKWYSMEWGGNQHSGGRTAVENAAKNARAVGQGLFLIGTAISLVDGVEAYNKGDKFGVYKSSVDVAAGGAATFLGPLGAVGGGTYFVTSLAVQIPSVRRYTVEPMANGFCYVLGDC
ncbi:hypothetical protein BM523_17915 [Alteromonas mediterranea]|uniref:RHS repeat-associated core domain-containing protein n=1 Tax=Alteromonas mediterranea TaxID=314275 RepID=UPI0009045A58|nr:RHS repeat-associated core domain-containing protein [Alteromonas mediterranea]APD95720.1 hypothetical protein BM523_17915 [Alteromonas mediterranea]APD99354.1 hypothetical protein BM525_17940 [Alteromonas mediterranea]